MIWFWKHGEQLFILFLSPIIGLTLEVFIGRKSTIYILICSCILLTPMVAGYSYVISWLHQFIALTGLSCLYSLYSRQIERISPKIISAIIVSGLLCLILGWFAFMDAFSGTQTVESKWETDDYRIEYVRDQGFSGRPLMKYELSKYGIIPIFIKAVDVSVDSDTVNICHIHFADSKIVFNKCDGTIDKLP